MRRAAGMRSWRGARQAGAYAVELAMALPLFLAMIFLVLEAARALYLINTLHEVSRRAASLAASTDFSDAAAMAEVRQRAVFRSSAGSLLLGSPVTDAHVRIDYLGLVQSAGSDPALAEIAPASLPACPANNRAACLKNPHDGSCIRLVRVRICDPADSGSCTPVPYLPALPLVNMQFNLPQAQTVAPAESLGFTPGMAPCS